MNLESQVVSLPLAKRLKELGVKSESLFVWMNSWLDRPYPQPNEFADNEIEDAWSQMEWKLVRADSEDIKDHYMRLWKGMYKNTLIEIPAFTVAELGEMLPTKTMSFQTSKRVNGEWFITDYVAKLPTQIAATEADARAKLLIHLLENNLLTPKP